jgi:predicted NUDIX family NTP pyrophosphohydrolase
MPISAGILLYRQDDDALRVLLAHPGGPFWRQRDAGAWTIPKGAPAGGESTQAAARREFAEETGTDPVGTLQPLGEIRQRGGKQVEAFALEADFDVATLRSNLFELEWPPRSGRVASFPEVDRVEWFTLDDARAKILPSQAPLLDRLASLLGRVS